jgi:acetyl esterase/lipase
MTAQFWKSPSVEMQMAPWLLPSMRRRYRGSAAPVQDLRVFDARTIPPPLADLHSIDAVAVAGVDATWINAGARGNGTIVFLHGGAYVFGPGPGHWDWLCAMCEATGMAGLMLLYDRAPEAQYPMALDEVISASATLDGDWVLAGDSAGGGLALAVAMRMRDSGAPLPRALVLSSPWLDLTLGHERMLANQHVDVMLGLDRLADYAAMYAGDHDRRDPGISPAFGDPTGLPPMLITVGGSELMLWECRDWRERCAAAGTPCDLIEAPGAIHDFAMARTLFPEARRVLPRMAAFARP